MNSPRSHAEDSTGLLNTIRHSNSPLIKFLRVSAAAFQLYLVSTGILGCEVKGGADNGAETGGEGEGEGEDQDAGTAGQTDSGETQCPPQKECDCGTAQTGEGEGEGAVGPIEREIKPGMMREDPITYNAQTNQSNAFGKCNTAKYVWTVFEDGTEGWLPILDEPGQAPEAETGNDENCNGVKGEQTPCDPGNIDDAANGAKIVCGKDGQEVVIAPAATLFPTDEKCDGVDNDLDGKIDDNACPTEDNPRAVEECDNPGKITITLGSIPAANDGEGPTPATSASVCALDDKGNTMQRQVAALTPIPGYIPPLQGPCDDLGTQHQFGSDVGECDLSDQFCSEGQWTKGYEGVEPSTPNLTGPDTDCDGDTTVQNLKARIVRFPQ